MVFLQSYRKATKTNHINQETNFLHVKHSVPHKKELNAKSIYAHQTCISLKYRSLPHGHECLQVLIVPQCTSDRQLWTQTYHSQEKYNNNIILWLGWYQSREINFVCQFSTWFNSGFYYRWMQPIHWGIFALVIPGFCSKTPLESPT